MLHVDPADPHDPVATNLIARLVGELADRYPEEAEAEAASFDPADAVGPRRTFVIAWFGADAVGCGALRPYPDSADTAELKRMYVVPAARGQGIGREILRALEAHARTFGYRRLVLETGKRQPEAVALYKKSGYRPTPNYPPYEQNEHSLCFEKLLAAR